MTLTLGNSHLEGKKSSCNSACLYKRILEWLQRHRHNNHGHDGAQLQPHDDELVVYERDGDHGPNKQPSRDWYMDYMAEKRKQL